MGAKGPMIAATSHLAYGPSIRISEDHGDKWHEMLNSPRFSAKSERTVDQIWHITETNSPKKLYAGTGQAALFQSDDGGTTWNEVISFSQFLKGSNDERNGASGDMPVDSIVAVPGKAQEPPRVWVAQRRTGVFRSLDGLKTWQRADEGLPPIVSLTGDPKGTYLYAQTAEGMFRSSDGGDRWQPAGKDLPSRFGFALMSPAEGEAYTVPLESQTERHAAGGRLRVYRTTNAGVSWHPLEQGLPTHPYYAGVLRGGLTYDELEPMGLYLGTTAGEIFYSPDRGNMWRKLPQSFTRITVVRTRVHK